MHRILIKTILASFLLFTQPTFATSIDNQRQEAGQAIEAEEFKKAFSILEKLAEQKDAKAQYHLARLYYNGLGTSRNYNKAAELYEAATKQGLIPAQTNLALMYRDGVGVKKDYDQAFELLKKSAAKNDSLALLNIGNMYFSGQGVQQNNKTAFQYYKQAADQGEATAASNTGIFYLMQQNPDQAFKYFKVSANGGDMGGMFYLIKFYLGPTDAPQFKNNALAYRWLTIMKENLDQLFPNPDITSEMINEIPSLLKDLEKDLSKQDIEQAKKAASAWQPKRKQSVNF